MILQNFHCHTTYCDGKDTPEEMLRKALELGMDALGFSGHSYAVFDNCCMTLEGTEKYRIEISGLREKYADRINIYCGIEQDIFSPLPEKPFDYSIGSVHYLKIGKEYISVDDTPQILEDLCRQHFGGDYLSLCEAYYETVSEVVEKSNCDIIGHFDLVTKYNEGSRLFDTDHPRYKTAWKQAADRLLKYGIPFEINTGAMAKGWRTEPYPSFEIISYIAGKDGKLILSSDAHRKEDLLYGFETVSEKLEADGIPVCKFTDLKNL